MLLLFYQLLELFNFVIWSFRYLFYFSFFLQYLAVVSLPIICDEIDWFYFLVTSITNVDT